MPTKLSDKVAVAILIIVLALRFGPHNGTPDEPENIVGGMRVMIVEETSKRSTLPAEQAAALDSQEVAEYLNEHCGKERDTGQPGWRKYDENTEVAEDLKLYQDMIARKRTSLPWLYIDKGSKHYSDKFPADSKTLMTVLQQYGGK